MSTNMHHLRQPLNHLSTQRGAALIVGLLLLLVLTVLAISGMNSASLEFLMAGNEQFKQDAFQAAESGLEYARAVSPDEFDPDVTTPKQHNGIAVAGTDGTFGYQIQPLFCGHAYSVPGSDGKDTTYTFYEVQSTGNSARNSTATSYLGIKKPGPADEGAIRPIPAGGCVGGNGGAGSPGGNGSGGGVAPTTSDFK